MEKSSQGFSRLLSIDCTIANRLRTISPAVIKDNRGGTWCKAPRYVRIINWLLYITVAYVCTPQPGIFFNMLFNSGSNDQRLSNRCAYFEAITSQFNCRFYQLFPWQPTIVLGGLVHALHFARYSNSQTTWGEKGDLLQLKYLYWEYNGW